jgi:hypothetical protein
MKCACFKACAGLILLLLCVNVPAAAQTVTATLGGRITDSSGGVIPKAAVTATNSATGIARNTAAGDDGVYQIGALQAGTYTITAQSKGFKNQAKSVVLQVGQVATLDFSLEVGEIRQQVTVEATSEVTEPTRTQVSTVIQARQIENLPVNGRQFIDFALLSPAVQIGDTTSGSTDVIVEPVTKLSFAGQNIHYNFIAVDGADDISTVSGIQRATPPQDSVREFRVVNTSYSTEFGRAVGGVINIITRSGTNEWHGSVYDYFRNNKMDAKSILQAPGLNVLRQNQFGAAIGGPIKKDRTFLYANYEGQRRAESPFYNSVVLANSQPNAANPGGLSNIDNVKVNIFHLPAEPKGLNVLRTGDTDNGFIRLDHNINDRQNLTVRYFVTDGRYTNQSPLNDGFDLPSAFKNNFFRDQSLVGNLTSLFSSKVVNEARVQYAHRSFDFPVVTTQPHLEVGNTFTTGVNRGNPDFYKEDRFELVDNVTLNLGRHTTSFGGNFNLVRTTESFPLFYPFEADFGSLQAFLGTDGAAGCPVNVQCPDPFVIFFERVTAPTFTEPTLATSVYQGGAISSAIRNQEKATIDHTYNGFYVQDKWRASNRMTVNFGLRWEFETWPKELLNNQYNNFDPRAGIAYNIGTKRNVVVRVGAGLFHGIIPSPLLLAQKPCCAGLAKYPGRDSVLNDANSNNLLWAFASSPFINNLALSALLPAPPATTANYPDSAPLGFCPGGVIAGCGFLGPSTVVRFDKTHQNPYGIQSSLSLEFDPLKDTTVSVTYLRVKGVHLGSFYNVNQPLPSAQVFVHNSKGVGGCKNVYYAPFTFALAPSAQCTGTYPVTPSVAVPNGPFPGTGCINQGLPCAANFAIYFEAASRWRSNYDGLLVNVSKRFSHHFSYGISYTWSKGIDDGPNPSFVLIPQDTLNFRAERALSADDVRHRFVGNAVLSTPATANMFIRDFDFGIILTLQSPQHFTKFSGSDTNGDIFGTNDRVGLENRDTFRGDTLQSVDLRLSRSFKIGDKKNLQFIAEAFNLLNTVNIRFFNTAYGSADFCNVTPVPAACGAGPFFKEGSPNPNYGTPRAVFNPRQIQIALRFSF